MDTIKNEILKLHLEKIIEKVGYKKVGNFINSILEEKDRYIPLEQYLKLFSGNGERIVESEFNYPNKFTLDSSKKILPLSMKIKETNKYITHGENYIKSSEIINPQSFGSTYNNLISSIFAFVLTENNDVLLLKCHLYPKKLVYFTLNLASLFEIEENTKTIKERPFERESFMLNLLPEFLTPIFDEKKRYEAYAIKEILFNNALNNIIQYNIGSRDDLYYIREGLKNCNPNYKEISILQTGKKKELIIKVDNYDEIKARYLVSQISVIGSKKTNMTYRTKSAIEIKNDINYIIVKAVEPGSSGKCHYIFVSDIKEAVDNNIADNKKSKNKKDTRFNFSALFHKDENGNFILEKDMENRATRLDYKDIFEVDLSQVLKAEK